jgi:hypothetical protein
MNDDLRFVVKVALRRSLAQVRGLNQQINEIEEDVIALTFLEQIDVAGYEILRKPGHVDLTFETPGGDGAV